MGFLGLLSRPWFRRAWVVQELAFAKEAMLICGQRSVAWSKLDEALDFVRRKRWYHHLNTDKIGHMDSVVRDPGPYAEFLRSKTSFGVGAINLSRTRRWITRGGRGPDHGGGLEMLIQMHRGTEASDPRDKVYAFLGLSGEYFRPRRSSNSDEVRVDSAGADTNANTDADADWTMKPMRPDYKLPVQDVYTDVTMRLMLKKGDLRMLSHVQDASHTNVCGLPSWVPDYSVQLQPYPLSFRGKAAWKACGPLKWTPAAAMMKSGLLPVQGFRIGTVQEAALLPKEAPDSAAYWASIVQIAAGLHDHYPIGVQRPGSGFRSQTRVEALWRTLIANTYNRQYPAPPSVGTLFLDYILNLQIRHTFASWSDGDFVPYRNLARPKTIEAERSAWHSLFAAEPSGSPYGTELYRERISSVVEGMFRGVYSPIGLSQLQHEFDIASGSMRRFFRTTGEADRRPDELYLGTGPRSLRCADEVWVLAGSTVPLILRPISTASAATSANDRYTLVGEAYVHGSMHWKERCDIASPELVDLVLE